MAEDLNEEIVDYWSEHYMGAHCTLCGNSGVIDTRATAVTAAGVWVGRLNFCICPNGQILRDGYKNDPEECLKMTRRFG